MTSTTDPRMPRVGDVITEEPPQVEGLRLEDRDGDEVRWDAPKSAWIRREREAGGWTRGLSWEDVVEFAPITVVAVPPEPEWPEVQPRDLLVGDEIEVTYPAGEHAEAMVRGVITVTGIGMVYIRDQIEVPLDGATIRRRPMVPEPGPGALWEAEGRRYFNTGARDHSGEAYVWTTPWDPEGSYDWDHIRTYPNLHELVAAPEVRS